MDNHSITLVLLILFIFITAFARHVEKTWFSPPALLMIIWIFIIGSALIFAPEYSFSPTAILYIFICFILFFIGHYLSSSSDRKEYSYDFKDRILFSSENMLTGFLLVCSFSIIAALILLLNRHGFTLSNFADYSNYSIIASTLSQKRYEGKALTPLIIFLMSLGYTGALVGGTLSGFTKKVKSYVAVAFFFIPVIIFTAYYTSRGFFLYNLVLFASSFLSTKLLLHHTKYRLFTRRKIIFSISIVIFLLALFLISQMGRMKASQFDWHTTKHTFNYLKPWFFSYISGFSEWFDSYSAEGLAGGKFTFSGLFSLMGLKERVVGIFDNKVFITDTGIFTNVYTIFRSFIEDFSFIGGILAFFILGAFSGKIFSKVIKGSLLYMPVLSALFALILWSFITSIFAYNSIIAAYSLFFLFIAAIHFSKEYKWGKKYL